MESLIAELTAIDSAVIAYSGGVDSSFLAYLAAQILADRMVAVTIVAPVDPPGMEDTATTFAAHHRFKHVKIHHNLLQSSIFRANPAERCYHCKLDILHTLWQYARDNQISVVLDGQNADDLSDYRPGRQAVEETGTFSPLAKHGFHKAEIRWLANILDLSIWDQPSSPCLATRIPYGIPITEENLNQVALAEKFLHENGFDIVRVRYHNELARIEVAPGRIADLLQIREEVVQYFKQIGFRYVAVDLQGYRLGSLNEGLNL